MIQAWRYYSCTKCSIKLAVELSVTCQLSVFVLLLIVLPFSLVFVLTDYLAIIFAHLFFFFQFIKCQFLIGTCLPSLSVSLSALFPMNTLASYNLEHGPLSAVYPS